MERLKNMRKGQALPLNTIVIAILVIIVLLVIIAFFVAKFGDTGNEIDKNSVALCSPNNPALTSLGYTRFDPLEEGDVCDSEQGWEKAIAVPDCCVQK